MQPGFGYSLLSVLRWLPRFPGKHRLAHRLASRLSDRTDVWLKCRQGLQFLVPSLKEPVAFELLIQGIYEAETQTVTKQVLSPGDFVVDIGANIGAFSIPASRTIGPGGRVLAIEASARVFPYLTSNLERNGIKNVTAVHAVAGSQEGGTLSFSDAPVQKFGMGSRAPWQGQTSYTVPARRLDALLAENDFEISRIRVLKIDVEGFELDVLRGAEQLLHGPEPPVVVFEFNDWAELRADLVPGDAQRHLLDMGYCVYTLSAYLTGRPSLEAPLTAGGHMLVAERPTAYRK